MSMRFRITDSPFPRGNPNQPRRQGRWLPSAPTRAAHFNARLAVQMGWAETGAFGYLRERLVGTAGPQGTFGYPATCAVVNGERRSQALKSRRRTFVPDLLTARWRCFSGTPGTAQP